MLKFYHRSNAMQDVQCVCCWLLLFAWNGKYGLSSSTKFSYSSVNILHSLLHEAILDMQLECWTRGRRWILRLFRAFWTFGTWTLLQDNKPLKSYVNLISTSQLHNESTILDKKCADCNTLFYKSSKTTTDLFLAACSRFSTAYLHATLINDFNNDSAIPLLL